MQEILSVEFVRLLIDKLLTGLLLAFAAFLLNRVLERYKSDQSIRAEIAKTRVTKMADAWKPIDELFSAIRRTERQLVDMQLEEIHRVGEHVAQVVTITRILPLDAGQRLEQEFEDALKQLRTQVIEASIKVDAEAFWLGRPVTREFKKQLHALVGLIDQLENQVRTGHLPQRGEGMELVETAVRSWRSIQDLQRWL